MHPNPVYRTASEETNLAFARERGFGIVSISGENGPLLAHVPFVVSTDNSYIELHFVRSNPIARALKTPQTAVIAVSGPDSYISPDWYGIEDQVPTWNYIAVHLRGTLSLRPAEEMKPLLDRLSARFEGDLLPKTPWISDKMTDGVMDKMMRMIVPARLELADVSGTWKLNQNKPEDVRLSAAKHVSSYGIGHETSILSALMQAPPDADTKT